MNPLRWLHGRYVARRMDLLAHIPADESEAITGHDLMQKAKVGAGSLYARLSWLEGEGLILGKWLEGPYPRRRVYWRTSP